MARFILPKDIFYGKGTMETLRSLRGERAILISGGLKKNSNLTDTAQAFLKQGGMSVRILNEMSSVTQAQRIKNGAKSMREFRPDWIVVIGDGNAISAAKAMWILYEHAWMQLESLSTEESFPRLRQQARLAVLPTEFGMAAEASPQCIIQDDSLQLHLPLRHYSLTPDVTVLDPLLMDGVSFAIATYSSLDALSYTFEALLSESATIITDAYALRAATVLLHSLPLSFNGNKEAKENTYYAQFLGGVALANTGGGLVDKLTFQILSALSQYHLPRGCISAILLPILIRERKAMQERLGGILASLGIETKKELIAENVAKLVENVNMAGGIPGSFSALGIREKDYSDALPLLAKTISEESKMQNHHIDFDDAKRLLREAFASSKYFFKLMQ